MLSLAQTLVAQMGASEHKIEVIRADYLKQQRELQTQIMELSSEKAPAQSTHSTPEYPAYSEVSIMSRADETRVASSAQAPSAHATHAAPQLLALLRRVRVRRPSPR